MLTKKFQIISIQTAVIGEATWHCGKQATLPKGSATLKGRLHGKYGWLKSFWAYRHRSGILHNNTNLLNELCTAFIDKIGVLFAGKNTVN